MRAESEKVFLNKHRCLEGKLTQGSKSIVERKKLEHKEEVAGEALKGFIPDFCNLSMEIRLTIPHITPVSARTQGRDCKDNEYNHISRSHNI